MNLQILSLRGLSFSYYATQAVLLPFLPLYFIAKGVTPVQVGLLMTIGPFVAVFVQPFWGYISDRFKTVKKVIFILWSLTIISSVGLFHADQFIEYFIFVLLIYFFMIPSVPLLDSITIKSVQRRGISYGSVRLFGSMGFMVSALLSGAAIGYIGGVENIHYIYWSIWIFPMGLLLFLKDEASDGMKISLKTLYPIFQNRKFLWFLLMALILSIPHKMNESLLGVYLYDLGASDQMAGWAWALAAGSEIPTFALLGRYIHKFHELALLGLVSFIYTIRWLVYSIVDDPMILVFLQATQMVTFAAFWLISIHYVVRIIPPELRSTGQSLFSAVYLGLSGILGGTIGGALNEKWGGASMYYFAGALALIAAIMFISTRAHDRKKSLLGIE